MRYELPQADVIKHKISFIDNKIDDAKRTARRERKVEVESAKDNRLEGVDEVDGVEQVVCINHMDNVEDPKKLESEIVESENVTGETRDINRVQSSYDDHTSWSLSTWNCRKGPYHPSINCNDHTNDEMMKYTGLEHQKTLRGTMITNLHGSVLNLHGSPLNNLHGSVFNSHGSILNNKACELCHPDCKSEFLDDVVEGEASATYTADSKIRSEKEDDKMDKNKKHDKNDKNVARKIKTVKMIKT